MPFVVSSPALCDAFPLNCPYCGTEPAATIIQQPYSKMALSKIPGHVKSETWKVELPSCQRCATWFRLSRFALFAIGAAALLLPFAAFAANEQLVLILWCASVAGWLGLLVWRRFRAQAFRIAYIGDGEVVYVARAESYASEFARRNNLSYQHRAIVMRLS